MSEHGGSSSWTDYMTFWNIVFGLNAAIGLFMLEYSWFKMRRFRNPNRDLDAIYPAYRRADAL